LNNYFVNKRSCSNSMMELISSDKKENKKHYLAVAFRAVDPDSCTSVISICKIYSFELFGLFFTGK
jgi:hypothetical protein